VRYTGLMVVRVPGTYRLFMTATEGRSAAAVCSVNGVIVTTADFRTSSQNRASEVKLSQGSVVSVVTPSTGTAVYSPRESCPGPRLCQ
jgi:hypothetical protein